MNRIFGPRGVMNTFWNSINNKLPGQLTDGQLTIGTEPMNVFARVACGAEVQEGMDAENAALARSTSPDVFSSLTAQGLVDVTWWRRAWIYDLVQGVVNIWLLVVFPCPRRVLLRARVV